MTSVRELSHTADVGFEVRSASLEELFAGAARGLVEALGVEPAEEGGNDAPEPLRLRRPDLERLLVHWLRELLARAAAGGEVPRPEVEQVRPGEGDEDALLRAEVAWLPASAAGPTREIKGVTYHGLAVERDRDGWHATVVFDV